MCTITPSPPAKKKTINNKDKNNMGNKKQVSFFDRVRIREIPLLSYDDEWSDDTSCDEDEYHDVDSEFEYQTDLERDSGEYHKALLPNNELEQRSSLSLKYSSNNHIVDFSGKIYSSTSSSSHHNSMKTDRWKSTKANRWKSTTSPKSGEPPHAQDDQPTSPLKLPPSSPSKTSSRTRSAGSCSIDFHKRLGRKKKEGHYFQPPPSPQNKSYLPVSSQRRTSSTESLTRLGINSSNRGSTPGKYWKKTTSAPSLRRLRFNKSNNNVVPDNNNNLALSGSRNATFGNTNSNTTSNSSNNRPPMLPSRRKTNNIFLNKINNSSNSSSSSVKSNKKVYNFNSIVDSSSSNHTSSIDDTTSTSATTTAISTTPEKVFDIDDDDHYVSDTESSAPENDRDDNDNSPLVTTVPESPSGSTNRRSLLSRGFGSLRSLTSMSPLSRKHKGRNDLPPKRPIRLLSVRKLLIEDLS